LCLACGDSSDAPAPSAPTGTFGPESAAGENEAPTLDSAAIVPSNASADDPLAVEIHADDADHDRLTTSYEWYKNDELVPGVRDSYVPAGEFVRGDRVHVIVYVKDKEHQVSLQTAELTIRNAAPRVDNVTLTPAKPTGQDLIEAQATGHDADS